MHNKYNDSKSMYMFFSWFIFIYQQDQVLFRLQPLTL